MRRIRLLLASCSVLTCILISQAFSQFVQEGSKLVGTDTVGKAGQGISVGLSADGNTAIVGGYSDNSRLGAAWVFTRTSGVWTQQGSKLVGTGAVGSPMQGFSVALSADGNTAIVGGETDNHGAGAAWVFARASAVWTQQGSKLVGTGAEGFGGPLQGCSVALSADGNTAIVGGEADNYSVGAAWVFTRTSGVWTQQGNKLVGTGAVNDADRGCSVSLSGDGNTALVGGYGGSSHAGAAWVFTRTNGAWSQQGSKLVGTSAVRSWGSQGWSVALSADGNAAIVGAPGEAAAWVFTRANGTWSQQGSKLKGTGAVGISSQGHSVALSAEGTTAIVGGDYDNSDAGAAWVFTRSGTAVREGPANVPSQFVLDQNYPNPFNPGTTIRFELPKASPVSLTLYDALGRKVAVLVNEQRDAGVHEVKFDGTGLSSGVYFYRITADNFVQSRKLVLLR